MFAQVENLVSKAQLKWHKVYKFQPKVLMNLKVGPYIVKTIETREELIESFRLRHEVFVQEFMGKDQVGLDFDKFDYFFDHLVIVHKNSNTIIGTYRLSSSRFTNESYTALEFDLSQLRNLDKPLLELGRACIRKDFRKGSIISLLWRGISEYMNLTETEILFGCTSIKQNSARSAALIYKCLEEDGLVSKEYPCQPTKSFTLPETKLWLAKWSGPLSEELRFEAQEMMPSLLKSYLKMGAKVASLPAYDADFDCLDLLTVLDKKLISPSVAERFQIVR